MNETNLRLAEALVGATYAKQAGDARRAREAKIKVLLQHKKLPAAGWDDATIEMVLSDLARMDSNNFLGNVGGGEREARVVSDLVARRHFRLGHGVGRSGDISAIQPKAAGSSIISRLTQAMALDAIQIAGVTRARACLVLPMATGMGLVMTFLTLRQRRPGARFIIWCRIDQKTCFKAMHTAGFVPLVVENRLEGDELRTDVAAIQALVDEHGADQILCVVTTTSCFAPRGPDRIVEVSGLCKEAGVAHVVNNAYGLQMSKCTHVINEAIRSGRLDAFVQSTDKNFMVPVGGSIVASSDKALIDEISKTYPGRASASPAVDMFITLLHLGAAGFKALLSTRKEVYSYLRAELAALASGVGERVLDTSSNQISLAMSLGGLAGLAAEQGKDITFLGAMLFQRGVSGTRVVDTRTSKTICGTAFVGYGAHCNQYPVAYLTVAAAVGMTKDDVDLLLKRLAKCMAQFRKSLAPATGLSGGSPDPASEQPQASGVDAPPTPAADPGP